MAETLKDPEKHIYKVFIYFILILKIALNFWKYFWLKNVGAKIKIYEKNICKQTNK